MPSDAFAQDCALHKPGSLFTLVNVYASSAQTARQRDGAPLPGLGKPPSKDGPP
jgi:hypothetical protein